MKKETLKRIFDFLENKENKKNKGKGTLRWKFIFNEPLTKYELIVNGDLNLANSKITYLPEGLEVVGGLDLKNCTSLTSLPEGLKVRGFLDIKHTQLKNYTDAEIRRNKNLNNGSFKGNIIR